MHEMTRFLLAGFVGLCLLMPLSADAMELVKDGRPVAVIVVQGDAPVIARKQSPLNDHFAAEALAEWIQKMTGARLQIVKQPPAKGPVIYIGKAAQAKGLTLNDIDSASNEGLRVIVKGDTVLLGGQNDESTVRAVGRLLERLGCRYLLDSSSNQSNPDLGKVIPKTKSLSIKDFEHSEKPGMISRRFWGSQYRGDPLWLAWNGDGGIKMATSHAWAGYVPRKQYFESHPEWFSLIDGKRVSGEWLCTSQQAVRDLVVQKILEQAKEDPSGSFSISPPDNRWYCQCDKCVAQDDPEQLVGSSGSVSMTPRFLNFFDEIGRRVYEKYPKVTLNFYAYADYTEPPPAGKRKRIAPNIVAWIAPIRYSRYHHIGNPNSASRVELKEVISGWSEICDIAYRTYNFNLAETTVPFSKLSTWAHDIPYLKEHGSVGFNNETFVAWGLMGPHLYQSIRLMYQPMLDSKALMDDYFNDYYADAAKPMAQYWRTIDQGFQNLKSEAGSYFSLHLVYTPEVLEQLLALFDQAKASTKDPLILERISKDRKGFAMAQDYMAWREHIAVGNMAQAKALTDQMYERAESDTWTFHGKTREYLRRFLRPISDVGATYTTGPNKLVQVLPDQWRMTYDPELIGEKQGYAKPGFNDSQWTPAATYSATLAEQKITEVTTFMWYRATFDVSQKLKHPALIFLDLDCLPEESKVFVNGQEITGDQIKLKRRRPSIAMPGSALKQGSNTIAILLDHRRISENALGGITRPILLCDVSEEFSKIPSKK